MVDFSPFFRNFVRSLSFYETKNLWNERLAEVLVKEKIVLGVKKLSILNDQNKEIELDKVEVTTKTRGRKNA